MNRESIELGFIMKDISKHRNANFSMNSFNDRLYFQKLVYLLQSFGIYLGYPFAWYLRGPYCSTLAYNGFNLQEVYDKIPHTKLNFDDKNDQENYNRFLDFLKSKEIGDLEIAASLHFLKNICTKTDQEIKDQVEHKQEDFTKERVEKIWEEMMKCQILK